MKIISFIAFILLIITDIAMIYMIINDLKYCNRHNKEDFILCLAGGILFFSIAIFLTFCVGCMVLR